VVGPTRIEAVDGWQVLDSRGDPTVAARVRLHGGSEGVAAVPAGASTGTHEAAEVRDGGAAWGGKGVATAVAAVRGEIAQALRGLDVADLDRLDMTLRELDGTSRLSRLGANAVLAVSVAAALALAALKEVPLWRLYTQRPLLPMPMVNIVSGGAHAGGLIDIQDVLVVPVEARSFGQALAWAAQVRDGTRRVAARHGYPASLVADEGGIAGPLRSNRAALELVTSGIEASGLRPGADVALALDLAASQFLDRGRYRWAAEGRELSAAELIEEVAGWCREFPVRSVEDVLGEDDWDGWREATRVLGGIQLVGDDLFATDAGRLRRGARAGVANAILIKPNQSGTLTSAHRVLRAAQESGYRTVVSARSGETEDHWLSDLAVGWRAGQIKVGSTTRGERLAKWNRLLRIEHDNPAAEFAGWR
jgi:enolase